MKVRAVWLDAVDAVRLGELLEFLGGWLTCDGDRLGGSLRRFVGSDAYEIDELRAELWRFAFLVGGTDGEELFGEDER
jgi:hypothetical protein